MVAPNAEQTSTLELEQSNSRTNVSDGDGDGDGDGGGASPGKRRTRLAMRPSRARTASQHLRPTPPVRATVVGVQPARVCDIARSCVPRGIANGPASSTYSHLAVNSCDASDESSAVCLDGANWSVGGKGVHTASELRKLRRENLLLREMLKRTSGVAGGIAPPLFGGAADVLVPHALPSEVRPTHLLEGEGVEVANLEGRLSSNVRVGAEAERDHERV
jgi:hypothetical protein